MAWKILRYQLKYRNNTSYHHMHGFGQIDRALSKQIRKYLNEDLVFVHADDRIAQYVNVNAREICNSFANCSKGNAHYDLPAENFTHLFFFYNIANRDKFTFFIWKTLILCVLLHIVMYLLVLVPTSDHERV